MEVQHSCTHHLAHIGWPNWCCNGHLVHRWDIFRTHPMHPTCCSNTLRLLVGLVTDLALVQNRLRNRSKR